MALEVSRLRENKRGSRQLEVTTFLKNVKFYENDTYYYYVGDLVDNMFKSNRITIGSINDTSTATGALSAKPTTLQAVVALNYT